MATDKFDKFMSNMSGPGLGDVVQDPKPQGQHKKQESPMEYKASAEQERALAEARNEHRGRPAVGAVVKKKVRIGFEADPETIARIKEISYKTGTPLGWLYKEALSDLVEKYTNL